MTRSAIPVTVFLIFAFLNVLGAGIPETGEARRRMMDFMVAPVLPHQEIYREVIHQRTGGMVFFRTYEQTGGRYYAFKPMDADGEAMLVSPGTWVIRRRIEDGAFEQIKIFLQYDEQSFLRIFPAGRTARMDVEIAGVGLYTGVPVPMTMERLITVPMAMLQDATAGFVDWSLLAPDPHEPGYRYIKDAVEEIRRVLPDLGDADDGAMDRDGRLVYIESLEPQDDGGGFNCSGFAKWVVDGFYYGRTGVLLPVEPLKRKHTAYRGTSWTHTVEDERDPFFGLDWTRNLALHMLALDRRVDPETLDPRAGDVREITSADRIENVGYRVEELQHVLYRLALREPGTFYLGSVNSTFGGEVVLRQHTHVVVFFPWFDGNGTFRVAVMERNTETGLESLSRRYAGGFVHLVRVSGHREFAPPPVGGAYESD